MKTIKVPTKTELNEYNNQQLVELYNELIKDLPSSDGFTPVAKFRTLDWGRERIALVLKTIEKRNKAKEKEQHNMESGIPTREQREAENQEKLRLRDEQRKLEIKAKVEAANKAKADKEAAVKDKAYRAAAAKAERESKAAAAKAEKEAKAKVKEEEREAKKAQKEAEKAAREAMPKPVRVRKGTNLLPPGTPPTPCREGTKQAALLDTLSRPEGATMQELETALAFGRKPWPEGSIRAGFGWDMKQHGYGVRSVVKEGETERFFIVVPDGHTIPQHRENKTDPAAVEAAKAARKAEREEAAAKRKAEREAKAAAAKAERDAKAAAKAEERAEMTAATARAQAEAAAHSIT
jgi:hypothetical protein